MNTPQKVSWWLATKVMWSFTWRYLVWVLLLCVVGGAVNGLLLVIAKLGLGFALEGPFYNVYLILSSCLITLALAINMFRMMLNKGEFKNFTFKPKEQEA